MLQGFDISYIMFQVEPFKCTSVAQWIASQISGAAIRNHFLGREVMYSLFTFLRVLMKKQWVGSRKKRFYGKIWGNAV